MKTDLEYIDIAKKEGAELLCGGKRLTGDNYDKGYFIEPTIFSGVTSEMRVAQEEVFGPVLALMVAEDFDDAMRIANDVRFGLSASIVSKDLTRVHQVYQPDRSGIDYGESSDRGSRVSIAFWWHKGIEFWNARTGTAGVGFLF